MGFFDIHSHILPGVDDGAKNTEEALKLLKMQKQQGVTSVMLTPHFDASYDNIEDFEEKVKNAYTKLSKKITAEDPEILVGAEVLFFKGISTAEGVERLCLANSNYMLIEFAIPDFTDKILKELTYLRESRDIIPIIAHIERYEDIKNFKSFLKLIENETVFSQVNAAAVASKNYKRQALKLIKKDLVTFIASDAHSTLHRPPKIKEALSIISDKFSPEKAKKFIDNSNILLNEIKGE